MPGKTPSNRSQNIGSKSTGSTRPNNKNRPAKKKKKRGWLKGWLKGLTVVFMLLTVLVLLIGIGGLTLLYSYIQDVPEFNPGNLTPPVTSYIYDREGNELTALYYDQNRIQISLDMIPPHVQNAFIAIEDERFYDHIGVDPIGIARAFVINLRQRRFTEQGGSTITQ